MYDDLVVVLGQKKTDFSTEDEVHSVVFETCLKELLTFTSKAVTNVLTQLLQLILVEILTCHLGNVYLLKPLPG